MIQPVLASSGLDSTKALAQQKQLADRPAWHRLLHYSRTLFGRYQSEIDDASFFLSPEGRRDPEAELNATLTAFFSPSSSPVTGGGSMDSLPEAAGNDVQWQPAACRFPARYAWLKSELGFALPPEDCSRFEKWKGQMDPGSLSIVFASYFMNNPASTYGHTFLRLNSRTRTNERLLDYAVNYAADVEGDNGVLYALKGLTGGYGGRFSTFPYYMKVQEYSNLESRDLWEYDLIVPPDQLERLVQHLWEMGNVRERYYFFNKNCSYYLLPVLEVMDPKLSVSRHFVFKTIPIDTVRKVIRAPGMFDHVIYRPSHATRMIAARKRLTTTEIRVAERAAAHPERVSAEELSSFPKPRRAMLLDSAYDLFRYQSGFTRDQPDAVSEKERTLLLMRNNVDVQSPALMISSSAAVAPHLGHKSGRLAYSYGYSNHSHFEELSARMAMHAQDDPPAGYLPGSQLEMFHLKLRYDLDREALYLQEFTLVDILSITPWDRWIHSPSWKVKTGLATANDVDHRPEHSLMYALNLGPGYAAWVPGTKEKALLYGLAEMVFEVGQVYSHDMRFGGGPSAGLLVNPCKRWRGRFQMSHFPYVVGGTPATTRLGLYQSVQLTQEFEFRVKLERQNQYKEVLFSLALFL